MHSFFDTTVLFEKSLILSRTLYKIMTWAQYEIHSIPEINLEKNHYVEDDQSSPFIEEFANCIVANYAEEKIDFILDNFKNFPILSNIEVQIFSDHIIIRNLIELNYNT